MALKPRIEVQGFEELQQLIDEAPEILKKHFELVAKGMERIPDKDIPTGYDKEIWGTHLPRALAWDPELFNIWWMEEHHLLKRGRVEPKIKELMAMLISQQNKCKLCVPYHAGAARFEGASEDMIDIIRNFEQRKHELPERIRKTLEFGLKAVYSPTKVTDEDVQALKDLGYNDAEIVELVAAALLAFQLSAFNQVLSLDQ